MTTRFKIAASFTKHVELFMGDYWGLLRCPPNEFAPEIFENRNTFVEEYRLRRRSEVLYETYQGKEMNVGFEIDHPETYRDNLGRIVFICSNYNVLPPPHLGAKEIYPLYCNNAKTYLVIFPALRLLRKAMLDANTDLENYRNEHGYFNRSARLHELLKTVSFDCTGSIKLPNP